MQSGAAITCTQCRAMIAVPEPSDEMALTCPRCLTPLQAFLFPAFYRPPETATAAAALLTSDEASCFYHPQKQAVRICDGCGRMICSLCAIDMGSEHLCPGCISAGRRKAKVALTKERVRYDNVALGLAVASVFMSFFAVIMAPAAIFVAIRYWNSAGGLNGPSRTKNVVAILVAVVALVFWVSIIGLGLIGLNQAGHHPRAR